MNRGNALTMEAILLAIALGFGAAPEAPVCGPDLSRAGVFASDDPEYAERPRLFVREKQPERTLRIGDPAPTLEVEEWSAGDPVDAFRTGAAYVVVFVRSSYSGVGPVLESISMLSDRFADRPVRVLGVAGEEERMSLETWRAKVEAMTGKIRFPLAWDKGVRTRTAYLTATGEQQPTMVYVIDPKGRLAWYGPPGFTSQILDPVLAGTWDLGRARNEIESVEDLGWIRIDIIRAQRAKDIERLLKSGERLTTEFADPPSPEFVERLRDDLLQFARDLLASDSPFDPRKEERLRALVLRAAERAAKIDHNENPRSLAVLARVQFINGDRASALKSARRALELAGPMQPPDRDLIEQLAHDVAEYGTP
ncbi:MAG: hypothetical protein KF691_02540 [Phycisphaeraceae bacterium]|nr:hypothetical protein [Phycisphaeraceae bacterium]